MENEQEENNLDENGSGNMNVVDDVKEHDNVDETEAVGDQVDASASSSVQESETASLDIKSKANLNCLSRTGCAVDTEEAKLLWASFIFCKGRECFNQGKTTMQNSSESKEIKSKHANGIDIVDDIIDDNNAFDIFNELHFCIHLTVLIIVWYWFHKSICFIT